MVWNREESIVGHHKRHPFFITSKWGAMRDGRIVAAQTEMIADGGAYASTSVEVLKCAATFAPGPYAIENVATDACVAYTNNVPSGAFRGFGSPQAHFAAESMVERLAQALGIDAVELRKKNLYREGDLESTGEVLPAGVTIRPVLDRCVEELAARFPRRLPAPADSPLRRGIGIACGMKNVGYSFGYPEQCTASVELAADAAGIRAAKVRIGAADVGQGTHLILRQIAAEVLGLSLDGVEIVAEDSTLAPNAGSASASRMTLMGGRAVKDAAEAALEAWKRGEKPEATVQYAPPRTTALDPDTGRGFPHLCYGYAAQAIEVEVDVRTGVTRVIRAISVHDVGRAINRQQVEATYLLPTTLDVPAEIYPVILEHADPNGPFGARGVAEMPLVPFAPAVAAAIFDATGAWVSDLPMTPERVLAAIREARRETRIPVVAR
jgi:CO/xanthine dehydrogenase Mo-binding subunit